MKKILASILVVAALAVAAFAQTDQRTVLATSTKNGVTTTLYVGRIQADPAKDGTLALTVFPEVILSDSTGAVISDQMDTSKSFVVPMTAAQYSGLAALVVGTYHASVSAKAPPVKVP